ncbi:MAG: ATP-grasp domain-containing protein [Snodgrassella sp.]|nr:ATP-grasp domain-containing protein [Snodgrassella sp.]
MHNVLILGARSPAGLTWARMMAKAGYRVHIAESLGYPLGRFSKYTCTYTRLPSPKQQSKQWLEQLIQLLLREKIDTVIPNCEEVFYLASADALIQQAHPCQLFTSAMSLLTQLHHKGFFAQLTQNWPVTAPETILLTNQAEFTAFKQQKFSADKQWVFKPAYSRFATRTLLCPKTIEYSQLQANPQQPWVAQQYIDGQEYCSYSIIRHGQLVAHSCYHPKYRVGQGAGIYFAPVQQIKIRQFVEHFAAQTHYHGQVGFDFIEDSAGRIYVLECNPRATSGIHFLEQLSQTVQTAIAHAVMQADAGLPATQLEMDLLQPAMHNLVMLFTPQTWRFFTQKTFWHDYHRARDAVWQRQDMLPYLIQLIPTAEIVFRAMSLHIDFLAATTVDIEWDGAPLTFY